MLGSAQSLPPAKLRFSAQACWVAQFCLPLSLQSCSQIRWVLVSVIVPSPFFTSAAWAAPMVASSAAAAAHIRLHLIMSCSGW